VCATKVAKALTRDKQSGCSRPTVAPMHKNKINLEKVLAALNTACPSCGYSISPAEIVRIDFERMKCTKCGSVFAPKPETTRKAN
jgi:ribosomal protein S27AE